MVPRHRLSSRSAIYCIQQRFFPRVKTSLFFLGVFSFWNERIPAVHYLDGRSNRRGGGIAQIKNLGERCLAAGMDGYVSKPIRTIELFSAIESVMHHRSVPGPGAPLSDQQMNLHESMPHESLKTKI